MHPLLRRASRPNRSGFTILEVFLALAVLLVAILAYIVAMTQSLRTLRETRLATLAKAAADAEMERRMNQSFAFIESQPFPSVFTGDLPAELLEAYPAASGTTNVCQNFDVAGDSCGAGNGAVKKVTVTVDLDGTRTWRIASLLTDWTALLAGAASSYYPPG
jgi:Tfp pilus assembly protein PilV